ncbi:MAG: 4'-phosphopantetheinyl transferase superfamily protein [Verrucomicrobiota bacterium]|nr:4'-phosphopantetheinyl transferase superfamily protein [Verrucomicrobiota bacterium]
MWTAEVSAIPDGELTGLHAHLNELERARAARFHFPRDRHSFVATRGLLRILLGAALDEIPGDISFVYSEHGKPRHLESAVRFSVSHSAGWAIFALAMDREVGVDLERAERLEIDDKNLPALAARVLSPRELESWKALADPVERRAAFLRAWTRKEALIKGIGTGIAERMSQIDLLDSAANPPLFADVTVHDARWSVYDLAAPASFSAALAVQQDNGGA